MFELSVAMKHIRTRRRQTVLVAGAVALAVAITIIQMSAANGMEQVTLSLEFQRYAKNRYQSRS